MADIRINALPTTATDFASDDYIAIDGTTNGTRKLNAKTANLTFSDVTLGSSGPSVKSSLSARAPRQGLVFDGTTGSSGTLGSIPSGTWTASAVIDVPTSNPASNIMALTMGLGYGVAGGGSFVLGDINTSGNLTISQWAGTFPAYREATISGFRAAYSGKRVHLAAVVTGAALTVYINGVATSYTEASGAGAPAWGATLGSANVFVGKGQSALYYFSGGIYAPYIYNRALSASEVVALYEAGAPSGADYNSASNTAVYSTDFSSSTGWSLGGSTTISGGKLNLVSNDFAGAPSSTALVIGKRYRFTITVDSITAGNVSYYNGAAYVSFATSAGTYTVDFTAAGSYSFLTLKSDGGNAVCDTFAFYKTGLLLAPDAAQAGGGLTWYDTSGNAANITLPASGVSWNVPTSGRQASLALNSTLSNATYGPLITQTTTGGSYGLFVSNAVNASFGIDIPTANTIRLRTNASSEALSFALGTTEAARFAVTTGNFLIGSPFTDGGQKLQVNGTTLFTGDVTLQGTSGRFYLKDTAVSGTPRNWLIAFSEAAEGDLQFRVSSAAGGDPVSGTVALGFDRDANATFAAWVKAGTAYGTAKSIEVNEAFVNQAQNTTKTVTVALPGGANGATFVLDVGAYGNSGTGYGSLLVKGAGYLGSSTTYDAAEIVKANSGSVTVSSVTKGNNQLTFTVINTAGTVSISVKLTATAGDNLTTIPAITIA